MALITPLFAQVLADPSHFASIGWLLVALASLATVANQAMKFIDRFKDKPHPADVRSEASDRYVHKPDFEKTVHGLKAEDEKLHSRIGGVERGARAHIDNQIAIIQAERAVSIDKLNGRNERIMFALGKIASKLNVDIEPTE